MGYIKGQERNQSVLFPGTVDEYIAANNEVRAIAAFIGRLDFVKLGFVRGQAAETGRPGYDPRLLMGLFLWGHLNGIRSSRKLERESQRNLEVIWLCEQLRPELSAAQLKEKIAGLERYLAAHEELARQLAETGASQVSLTDPEAKLMKTAKGSEVSYNVQTAVDSKHKLIVACQVTNERNDLG